MWLTSLRRTVLFAILVNFLVAVIPIRPVFARIQDHLGPFGLAVLKLPQFDIDGNLLPGWADRISAYQFNGNGVGAIINLFLEHGTVVPITFLLESNATEFEKTIQSKKDIDLLACVRMTRADRGRLVRAERTWYYETSIHHFPDDAWIHGDIYLLESPRCGYTSSPKIFLKTVDLVDQKSAQEIGNRGDPWLALRTYVSGRSRRDHPNWWWEYSYTEPRGSVGAESQVWTINGPVAIESITRSAKILRLNLKTGVWDFTEPEGIIVNPKTRFLEVRLLNQTKIAISPEQVVYSPDINTPSPIRRLDISSTLTLMKWEQGQTSTVITEAAETLWPRPGYSLIMEGDSAYVVNGVIVRAIRED